MQVQAWDEVIVFTEIKLSSYLLKPTDTEQRVEELLKKSRKLQTTLRCSELR